MVGKYIEEGTEVEIIENAGCQCDTSHPLAVPVAFGYHLVPASDHRRYPCPY